MNAAGSSTDAPSHSPSGKTAGAAKQEPTSAPMETDAAEGGSASGDVSGVKVEQSERSSFEEVSGTKDVHMQDAGDTGKHDADEATGSSPPGEEPMPDINSSSSADASDEEKLHDQGIWGKQKNIVEPGAYEAEARATAEAEANNEQAFENIAGAKEKASLIDTDEYKDFVRTRHLIERLSPLTKLADQQHGYALAGLYHDVIRFDEIGSFKVQHMGFRIRVNHHNHMKYNLSEEDLIDLNLCAGWIQLILVGQHALMSSSGQAITGARWMIVPWPGHPEPERRQWKSTITFSRKGSRTQPRQTFCQPGGTYECNASLLPGSRRGRRGARGPLP